MPKDDYAGLSPEEQEALDALEDDTDEPDADAEPAAQAEDDDAADESEPDHGDSDEEDAPELETAAEADAGAGDEGDAADEARPEPGKTASEDDRAEREFTPRLDSAEELEKAWKEVQAASDKLGEDWEAGELDHKDYHKKFLEIADRRARIQAQAQDIQAQQRLNEQRWNWEVESFLEDNERYKDPVLQGALNSALQGLYTKENEGKPYKWYLRQAAKQVEERFLPAQQQTRAAPKAPALDIPKAKKADPSKAPKTLGGVPEAMAESPKAGKFAHLDNLSGMRLEAALAKLSPEDANAYLEGL